MTAAWVLVGFALTGALGDTTAYILHRDARPAFATLGACEGQPGISWAEQFVELRTRLEYEPDEDTIEVACELEGGLSV